MKEIKCPHCGKTFTPSVDEYNDLLSQVRNEQFEIELKKIGLRLINVNITDINDESGYINSIQYDGKGHITTIETLSSELRDLKNEYEKKIASIINNNNLEQEKQKNEIERLKDKLNSEENRLKLEIEKALLDANNQIAELKKISSEAEYLNLTEEDYRLLDEIREICDEHGAVLIEDAAESLGATYKGRMTGSFGNYNAISFNGNKIITTSGGGMLLTHSKEAADKATADDIKAKLEAEGAKVTLK